MLEDGTSFDTETLLTKDTVLIAKFAPSSFALNFNANGLNFANNTDSNLIEYKRSCHEEAVATIAHTSNLNDDGTYKEEGEGGGDMSYPNYAAEKTVISVPGATKLKVTINYGIEEGYDALFVFAGNYNGSDPTSSDGNYGQIATLSSGYDNVLTRTLDVVDGTVTFFFYSDS